MNNKLKDWGVIAGAVTICVVVTIILMFLTVNGKVNKAIRLEESIIETKANISLTENARNQKVVNLVDTIKSYNDYEASTMATIVEARKFASEGNVEQASQLINVVVEQYPELKSQENYKVLMNEISVSENGVTESRKTYNGLIKEYNSYTRKMVNKAILRMGGYEKVDFETLTIETDSNLNNIWGD